MLASRTPKSNRTYNMVRVGFSKSPNYTKCQLSSAEAKNNCILEPPKPHFQFRFRSANSFGKITKMGPQKSHKIIQITLILARTSFLLNSRIFRFAQIREGWEHSSKNVANSQFTLLTWFLTHFQWHTIKSHNLGAELKFIDFWGPCYSQ